MDIGYKNNLKKEYEYALQQPICGAFKKLKMYNFCRDYPDKEDWQIGPFETDGSLTFTKKKQLNDPTGIGWKSSFIFNPSLIKKDGKLYLFYRAAVKKESLGSRIGLAVYSAGTGWTEYEEPVIFPEDYDEAVSCEDPKVYAADGKYYMFYNGVWRADPETMKKYGRSEGDIVINIKCAESDDLISWRKTGIKVPLEISRLWAKGAVIPRGTSGEAIKINGKYMMFLSEGCGGFQYVGYSQNMKDWTFEKQEYLKLPDEMGKQILEVACAPVLTSKEQFILDFFYYDRDGEFGAAQALYNMSDPLKQLKVKRGGTLAWGGLIEYNGHWLYPQGWDSPDGREEMYFYRSVSQAPQKKKRGE